MNHWRAGILTWVVGDRSAETFQRLWSRVQDWQSFWYVTDGYPVCPVFVENASHLVSKTANRAGGNLQLASGGCAYMTRVEGENTRLRHYLARLHRNTLCYSCVS